jgi:hypothetical protein
MNQQNLMQSIIEENKVEEPLKVSEPELTQDEKDRL